jgi:hypothetical protein
VGVLILTRVHDDGGDGDVDGGYGCEMRDDER